MASWRGEASLLTWAYQIGVNYLLNLRRQTPQKAHTVSFEEFRDGLADGLAVADYAGPDAAILTHEVLLSCTQAMLQYLGRDERVAYVLGSVFELPSPEAAAQIGRLHDAAAVLRAHPDYAAPREAASAILALLNSSRFPLLRE